MTIFCRVSLQAFEYSLCILQNTGTLGNLNGSIAGQRTLIPCAILVVGHISLVSLDVGKSKISPINVLLLHDSLHSAAVKQLL